MKKVVFFVVLLALCCSLKAQSVFTCVEKYDKNDRLEWTRNVKTTVTKTESAIVFATAGQNPVTYRYYDDGKNYSEHYGTSENLKILYDDVWGFETVFLVVPESVAVSYPGMSTKDILDATPEFDLTSIVFRVTSKASDRFIISSEMVWIESADGSRLIYFKD